MGYYGNIKEEELKNKVAAEFFGKYDCTRIEGNIDFCVMPRVKDPQQLTFVPEDPLFWAEAKNHPTDVHRMLAQLILTIHNEVKIENTPPRFIGCFDNEKIAFVEYHHVLPVFNLNDFNWTQTPSAVDEKTVETVRRTIPPTAITAFRFGADNAEIKAFVRQNLVPGDNATLSLQINKNNFIFVYQKWRAAVMPFIDAKWDTLKQKYAIYDRDFFLADLNVDDNGTPELEDDRPAQDFYITFDGSDRKPYRIKRTNGDDLGFEIPFAFKPGGLDAYAAFWRRYKRPPKKEYWDYIVKRLDLLVPQDVRERKGSFFTPAIWVEKSQQTLADVLGENWQDEYTVWDCCGGTGNLEQGLTNKYNVWVSTLDQQDVDVIRERIRNGANLLDNHVFQFDFLNDDFDKLPPNLKAIIDDPEKRRRLVVYINPPYAEAGNVKQRSGTGENKTDVSRQTVAHERFIGLIGPAARELFIQFLMVILAKMPECVIGCFSKLKYIQSQNFKAFRSLFRGHFGRGFIVPAKTFDNVKGEFPIGFLVWQMDPQGPRIGEIETEVFNANGECIGQRKFSPVTISDFIINWLRQYYDKKGKAIGFLRIIGPDLQNDNGEFITNTPSENDIKKCHTVKITTKNILAACVYFSVRHVIDHTWQNDRDQYTVPNCDVMADLPFVMDCLALALFDGQNRINNAGGVNHWIPFTEAEVDAKEKFASHFMTDFIGGRIKSEKEDDLFSHAEAERSHGATESRSACCEDGSTGFTGLTGLRDGSDGFRASVAPCEMGDGAGNPVNPVNPVVKFSPEARAVFDAGRELWRYYHAQPVANPNASYYDIRAHFKGFKPNGTMNAASPDARYTELVAALRAAMKTLAARIAPKVYEYGFLK